MKPVILLILDGLGHNPSPEGNAVAAAETPNLDWLSKNAATSLITTHGERVGLPDGQMGNSEVGHLNLGAGRVVEQDLSRINSAIASGEFSSNEVLKTLEAEQDTIHLVGLSGDGGVHSQFPHLFELLKVFKDKRVYVHFITDGRDGPQRSALEDLKVLESNLPENAEIASVSGRYYAMDRDKRWERLGDYLDKLLLNSNKPIDSVEAYIASEYDAGRTDEFIKPAAISSKFNDRENKLLAEDGVVFFNFRADRMRQLVSVLLGQEKPYKDEFEIPSLKLSSITEYDEDFGIPVLFPPIQIQDNLGETVSSAGLRQLRVAETEKYPHVTWFFNSGFETPYEKEDRALLASPRDVPTYDLKPEMAAGDITDKLLAQLSEERFDLAIVNYANCDMVGHTGVFEAAVAAVETVDKQVGRVTEVVKNKGYSLLVTADHGNAELMIHPDSGKPHTFHTTFKVPIYLYNSENKFSLLDDGALCDVAPTILDLLELKKPDAMTGKSLIED